MSELRHYQPFAGLHRIVAPQCPPCHGRCHQGRTCNAAPDESCADEGAARSLIDECTDFGEIHNDVEPRMPVPSNRFVVAIGLIAMAAVGCCLLIAGHLPLPG